MVERLPALSVGPTARPASTAGTSQVESRPRPDSAVRRAGEGVVVGPPARRGNDGSTIKMDSV